MNPVSLVACTSIADYALALIAASAQRGAERHVPACASIERHALSRVAEFSGSALLSAREAARGWSGNLQAHGAIAAELTELVNAAQEAQGSNRAWVERLFHTCMRLRHADTAPGEAAVLDAWQGSASKTRLDALLADQDVVACYDDAFSVVAAALAIVGDRPLRFFNDASELFELARGARSLTIVGAPSRFGARDITTLTSGGLEHVPFGVLTAHTVDAASRLVAKRYAYASSARSNHLVVIDKNTKHRVEGDVEILSLDEASVEQARRLANENFDMVGIASHGDAIDGDLNAVVLCGRPSQRETKVSLTKPHTCVNLDHCPRVRGGLFPRLPIDSIRCKVLFSETCAGISLSDGVFPSELSLALGALDGLPAALLSTTKIIRATGVGPVFASALVSAGMPLGEVHRSMSALHRSISEDAPSFLLLGDASLTLRDPAHPVCVLQGQVGADGEVDLGCSTTLTFCARVDLTGPAAEQLATLDRLAIEVRELSPDAPSDADDHYAAIVRHSFGAPVSVFFFSARPIRYGRLRFRLHDAEETLRAIDRTVARVEGNAYLVRAMQRTAASVQGFRATPARKKHAADLGAALEQADQIITTSVALAAAAQHPVVTVPAAASAKAVLAWLERALAQLDVSLASKWDSWDMPHYLVPLYQHLYVSRGKETSPGPCYLCQGSSYELRLECPTRPLLERTVTHCPRCGILFDRASDAASVEIHGPSTVRRGSTLTQTYCLKNTGDTPVSHAGAANIEGSYAWFSGSITMSTPVVSVPAQGQAEVTFELTPTMATTPGVYNLVLFTSSQLATNISLKPITVLG